MKEPVEKQIFISAYEAYSDAIFRYCFFRTYDREHALDIMQEAFTRVWNYMISGKRIDNIRAFLYKTARNIIIDDVRKRKDIASLQEMEARGKDPWAQSQQQNYVELKEIFETIKKLEKEYQEIILMRYIQGLTPREIAKITGLSESNVSVRIHRGIKQLQKILNV